MIGRPTSLVVVAASVSAMVGVIQLQALSRATARYERAESMLRRTASELGEILALRSRTEHAADGRQPEQDVIARVNDTLRRAGINPGAFRGQTPEADSPLPEMTTGMTVYRRQAVRLSFSELTPSQIGAFLSTWGQEQPMWIPSRIDLVHRRGADRGASTSARYDATVILSTLYAEIARDTSAPQRPDSPTEGS